MALKEGRCLNCGSILFLDPKSEKGHCLFCDAVFDNKEAFLAAANPSAYEFKNEEQPPYEGPNLDPRPVYTAPVMPVATKRPAAREPEFVSKVEKVPELVIPQRKKMILIGATVLVVAVFLAIFLPLTLRRDRQREEIRDAFAVRLSETVGAVDLETNFNITNQNNSQFILSLTAAVDEAKACEIYETYCEVRSEAMDIDAKDRYDGVSMRLVTPDGGYLFHDNPVSENLELLP
jgi:hypothetical protein